MTHAVTGKRVTKQLMTCLLLLTLILKSQNPTETDCHQMIEEVHVTSMVRSLTRIEEASLQMNVLQP